ncbi:MAG: glycosyltransferase family 2 protein [Chloroflexota bacterium]
MIFIEEKIIEQGSVFTMSDKSIAQKRAEQSVFKSGAELDYMLARAWLSKGRLDDAAARLKKIILIDPMHEGAYVTLAKLLAEQEKWTELIGLCQTGLSFFPNRTELHKGHIQALRQVGGFEASCTAYGMARIDSKSIQMDSNDLLISLGVKNEICRLPWYLTHYRRLGIQHFFVVDNGSDDGTLEYLIEQPDVYVWRSNLSFNAANGGASWAEIFLQEFGIGRWCLIADADEILVFEGVETDSPNPLATFCHQLDQDRKRAASGLALEMYSDRPLLHTHCTPGKNFLDICSYFDKKYFHEFEPPAAAHPNQAFHWGGMRKRVFGDDSDYILTKTPLLKYQSDTLIPSGFHYTNFPAEQIAHQAVCVLHFKYFSQLITSAAKLFNRYKDIEYGDEFKAYVAQLKAYASVKDDVFYDPAVSVQYSGPDQLVELGIIHSAQEKISA